LPAARMLPLEATTDQPHKKPVDKPRTRTTAFGAKRSFAKTPTSAKRKNAFEVRFTFLSGRRYSRTERQSSAFSFLMEQHM
jgi:hypothetical protein